MSQVTQLIDRIEAEFSGHTATQEPSQPGPSAPADPLVAALADVAANFGFIEKVAQIHDHKGTLIVFWHEAPSDVEKQYFVQAWASKVGDGSTNVEHEI